MTNKEEILFDRIRLKPFHKGKEGLLDSMIVCDSMYILVIKNT